MSTALVGGSVWERKFYDHLVGHIATEEAILGEYRKLAEDESLSAAFRYLASMILDDEVRHHQTFRDLAETVRISAELGRDEAPIPSLHGLRADREQVLEETERMLAAEQADLKDLKGLVKELKDFRETTLWALNVEVMRLDTEKHIAILKFIRDRANEA